MDRRVARTQKAIKEALLALMEDKSFEKISVKEICERADVGNRTFYLHFLDKYDVVEKMITFHMKELESICAVNNVNDIAKAPELWLKYMFENITFFKLMFDEDAHFAFQYQFIQLIKKMCNKIIFKNNKTILEKEIILQFIVYGVYGVTKSFIQNPTSEAIPFYSEQINSLVNQIDKI